jgi:beta-carotene 3-hydroxylase
MGIGTLDRWRPLLWVGVGVTAYGLAYLIVHDLGIHRRIPRLAIAGSYIGWVRDAHRVHHLYGRAPYGFLLPVVPATLRERARGARGDEDGRRNATATVPSLRGVETLARREKTS